MSKKSRLLTNGRYLALALAMLGLFFASGIKHLATAQEVAVAVMVDETIKVESVPASDAPTIAPVEEEEKEEVTGESNVSGEMGMVEEPALAPETVSEEVVPVIVEITTAPVAPVLAPTPSLLAISDEQGSASSPAAEAATNVTSHESVLPSAISFGLLAISEEQGGNTAASINGENNFTTSGVLAGENSFTTGSSTTGENSFTTLAGGGGCVSNCGGGGGGGSGGGGRVLGASTAVPFACPLYLREYIRLGRNNNPVEVRKLQAFLNVFGGERLAITGVYTRADFEAVERFQSRYLRDVLNPWGISEPTGYVFITTRLAINNVYCHRSTANDLDLRNYYSQIYGQSGVGRDDTDAGVDFDNSEFDLTDPSAASTSSTTPDNTRTNFFQAAALGLLNLFNFNAGAALITLLVLAIIFMLVLIWRLSRYPDMPPPKSDSGQFYALADTDAEDGILEDEILIDESEVEPADLDDSDPVQPPLDRLN